MYDETWTAGQLHAGEIVAVLELIEVYVGYHDPSLRELHPC
jgi:hypothetical protein